MRPGAVPRGGAGFAEWRACVGGLVRIRRGLIGARGTDDLLPSLVPVRL